MMEDIGSKPGPSSAPRKVEETEAERLGKGVSLSLPEGTCLTLPSSSRR